MKLNLTNLLKSVYTRLVVLLTMKPRWFAQYRDIKKNFYENDETNSAQEIKTSEIERVLILIPHADDELIGCFQLMQKLKLRCRFFYFGFTGSNLTQNNKTTRLKEIRTLCEKLNMDLSSSTGNYSLELELTISEFMPSIIAVPSFIDWHEEHINSNKILKEVLLKKELNPKILVYQISVPISENKISHYIPMSHSEQNLKWKYFLKFYRSQNHIPIYRFRLQERLNGRRFNCYAAEIYLILTFKDWKNYLTKALTPLYMDQFYLLNEHINNIKEIRRVSSKLYNSVFN